MDLILRDLIYVQKKLYENQFIHKYPKIFSEVIFHKNIFGVFNDEEGNIIFLGEDVDPEKQSKTNDMKNYRYNVNDNIIRNK